MNLVLDLKINQGTRTATYPCCKSKSEVTVAYEIATKSNNATIIGLMIYL